MSQNEEVVAKLRVLQAPMWTVIAIYPRTGDGMSTLLRNLGMWMVNRGINLKLKTKIIGAKQLGEVVRLYLRNDSEEYHLDFER